MSRKHYDENGDEDFKINELIKLNEYLKNTNQSIILNKLDPNDNIQITCYCDASHANDLNTRKSQTGYLIQINEDFINAKSIIQQNVSKSSYISEIYAINSAAETTLLLFNTFKFTNKLLQPIMWNDNDGAVNALNVGGKSTKNRFHDTRIFWMHNLLVNKTFKLLHIPGIENPSDLMTKDKSINARNKFTKLFLNQTNN